jgi:prepilin-type N-terminal cleavage/methylation domain-containing protein
MKKSKGFTLIELLIVIAILGILGSILLVSLTGTPQAKARDSKRVGDIASLRLLITLFYTDCGSYPDSLNGASNSLTSPPSCFQSAAALAQLPTDPKWSASSPGCTAFTDNQYKYAKSGTWPNITSYVLAACLEDSSAKVLESDRDGTVLGINCADPVYCIGQ